MVPAFTMTEINMNRFRVAMVAGLGLAILSSVAFAAGNWSTLPVVGQASFCASTVTGTGSLGGITGQGQGTTGSICAQTVPAGPPSITGLETVPADTNIAGLGAQPQTVRLSMASLNSLPYAYYLATSATIGTITTTANTGMTVIDYSGTITSVTVVLPPTPIDGQRYYLTSTRTISTLTINAASGDSLANGANPSVLTVSTTVPFGYAWVYQTANRTWYRFQ